MMRPAILDRYVLRQFLPILFAVLMALTGLFTISALFDSMDRFLNAGSGLGDMALYALLDCAPNAVFVLPMSLLVSVLLTMVLLERTSELTAMNVAGRSYLRASVPMIWVAAAASLFSFLMQEYVVPRANRARKDFMDLKVTKLSVTEPQERDNLFILGSKGRVFVVKSYLIPQKRMIEPVMQVFRHGRLVERTDARDAQWIRGRWEFHKGVQRTFTAGGEQATHFAVLSMPELGERPEDFAADTENPDEMPLTRLGEYIQRLRESGRPADRFDVDYHIKLSYPLINFIALLLAVGITGMSRRSNAAVSFLTSIVVSFLFYGLVAVSKSLGQSGVLPPWIAGWVGLGVFGAVAAWMLARSPR